MNRIKALTLQKTAGLKDEDVDDDGDTAGTFMLVSCLTLCKAATAKASATGSGGADSVTAVMVSFVSEYSWYCLMQRE